MDDGRALSVEEQKELLTIARSAVDACAHSAVSPGSL